MQKIFTLVALFFILFNSFMSPASATTVKEWGGLRLDSAPPSDKISAQIINDYLEKHGQSKLAKDDRVGKAMMDASVKNGINPVILLGMFTLETGWGSSGLFTQNYNPGGIKCKTGFPCAHSPDCEKDDKSKCIQYTKFESVEQGFQTKAEILRGYMIDPPTDDPPAKTFEDAINIYAPSSDGNVLYGDGGYIAFVGKTADNLGITIDEMGGTLTPDPNGTGEYEDGTKVGTWSDFFMQDDIFTNNTGVDKGNSTVPTEVSYAFKYFSEETVKKLAVAGVVLSLGILVYISLIVFSFTLVIKGHATPNSLFGKLVRLDGDLYSKKTIITVVSKCALGISIVGIYLSGLYLYVMGALYGMYQNIIFYLFG